MCPHGGLSLGTVVVHIYLNTINVVALKDDRVDHQRSDIMYSRTLFPGIRTNVVYLLHTKNVALLVVRLYTKSEERARLYHWFMPSKRSLSDVT